MREAIYEIMPRKALDRFETRDGTDFAYSLGTLARFRVNVLRQLNGIGAVFRAIPSKAQTLEQLSMPEAVRNLCQGLERPDPGDRQDRLRQVDDARGDDRRHQFAHQGPHPDDRGPDRVRAPAQELPDQPARESACTPSPSRPRCSRPCARIPDVILVGELRDLETISTAITAAEMGILVMATLHTNGAAATVDRIVNAFPADKQSHVRTMLSTSLRGVVSQQLIPRKGSPGRVAALEILINTPAAANLIRQGKIDQLESTMQSGAAAGMRTMDSAIEQLFDQG